MVPVAPIAAVVHVLGAFERVLRRDLPGFTLPESLTAPGAPELRVIITDGRTLFFALHPKKGAPKLFGGIDLETLQTEGGTTPGRVSRKLKAVEPGKGAPHVLFGPESIDEKGRIEISVTGLAKDLPKTAA